MTQAASLIAKRYAKAFFTLAEEKKKLAKIAEELETVLSLAESSEPFKALISNPVIPFSVQGKALEAALAKMGADKLTKEMLLTVAKNRRLGILPEIIKAFQVLVREKNNEIEVNVTTAVSLQDKQKKDLLAALEKATGNKVLVYEKIDENILGGVVVTIGSKMLDGSVAGKIEQLKILSKDAIKNI